MYPYPTDMNVTSWTGLLLWANTVTNYWFGNLILLAIWLILFISIMMADNTSKGFAVASFITAILAILFNALGIINELTLIIAIVFAAIGIIIVKKSE